jgi:hypothetical protein
VIQLSIAPGATYSLLTILVLPILGSLTWQLVKRRTTQHRLSVTVLTLGGGGLVLMIGLLKGLFTGIPLDEAVFEFDPDLISEEIDVLVLSQQRRTDNPERHRNWAHTEGDNAKWQVWQRRIDTPVRRAAP